MPEINALVKVRDFEMSIHSSLSRSEVSFNNDENVFKMEEEEIVILIPER